VNHLAAARLPDPFRAAAAASANRDGERRRTEVVSETTATVQRLLAVLFGLSLVGPVSAGAESSQPVKPALTVHIKDYAFGPKAAHVRVGDTVMFVNDDDETHTVTSTDGSFDSKGLTEKATFSHTFTKPGTYAYHCTIHTSMKGSIVVETSKNTK
jgi:plastocyanin